MSANASSPDNAAKIGTYAVENRSHPRHRLLQRCLVRPHGAPRVEGWRSIAHNISLSGIGITMPCPLESGTIIEIEAWGLQDVRRLEARVIHSRPVDFLWFCGCELVQQLREEELHAWLKGPLDWLPDDPPNLASWQEEFPLL
jgi:hypothetical protein